MWKREPHLDLSPDHIRRKNPPNGLSKDPFHPTVSNEIAKRKAEGKFNNTKVQKRRTNFQWHTHGRLIARSHPVVHFPVSHHVNQTLVDLMGGSEPRLRCGRHLKGVGVWLCWCRGSPDL